jgi:translocation and assembly module TamB
MTRRTRTALISSAIAAMLLFAAGAAAVLALRSEWFRERVRQRIVSEAERATGGRAEIGSFSFDWRAWRAEVRDFVLHGTEGPEKPPLFQAKSVAVGLKVVSLLKKDVEIDSIRVEAPRVYLIVYPDGSTNMPAREVRAGRPAMETILALAVGRFHVDDGVLEIEGQGRTPFSASGRHLTARLGYDAAGPRYQGDLSLRPLDFTWGERRAVPVDVNLAVGIHSGRVEVTAGRLAAGASHVEFSGAVENLAQFQAAFDYQARLELEDLKEFAGMEAPPSGEAHLAGKATFDGLMRYEARGRLNAGRVAWRRGDAAVRGLRADAAVSVTPEGLEARNVRLAGDAAGGRGAQAHRVDGRVERLTVRGNRLEAAGILLSAMGGGFAGQAELRDWHAYSAGGEVTGLEVRRLLALYSPHQAPWDGLVSGPVRVEGSLRADRPAAASARATITPSGSGPPVRGYVEAAYSAQGGTLDLGRSWLQLPATRLEFSGAMGKELAVRMESRNLDDVLPALNVESLPVRLENGSASFQGTVTGSLEAPRIAGRVSAAKFTLEGMRFDALDAAIALSETRVELREARASRGGLRAHFEAIAGLKGWKPDGELPVYATGTVRDAAVAELLAMAGREDIPATGVAEASGKVTGRWGAPMAALDITVVKGSLWEEPFDRAAAKVDYRPEAIEIGAGVVESGSKRIELKAHYSHRAGDIGTGRLRFEAASNEMPLQDFQRVRKERPDLGGAVQFAGAGEVDVRGPEFRLLELKGSATAAGVAIGGAKLGDARLTAATEGGVLRARLDSDFAGSTVGGEGEWRLANGYPGKARANFTRLDFLRLHELFMGSGGRTARLAGSIAGEIAIEGPLLRPDDWKAAANIAQLQIGLAAGEDPGRDLTLRNSGPVRAGMEKRVVKIESARFVGRSTDLTVAGTATVAQKNALDLKVKGRLDLAVLRDFDRDIEASGFVTTDASVRGTLGSPQVNGRMEMRNAAFSLATFPQGIYNANGTVSFTGTRATIQELVAESGGGKVRMGGFVSYEDGGPLFRLFLRGDHVRVRYPEGVSTVANAALNWTGTAERSTMAGTITIVRTGFNPQSDFSSILARSAEPVRTPTARVGILGGMNFDVQIETAPDITFESSLAQDIQAEANLRLRGTATNPSMLGRITITQGRLVFFGTRYSINQGSVAFYNPSRIEPILNVDLETKARGVDVTLTVSGPITKLNLTPRSDPPLQFNEIVALLATGRAPTSDPAMLSQQATAPQSWQQMGASALLGQAIANPVAGRLQRFFGVTRLKIDPSLTGFDNNPQAKLTLEQQITPNITFTYITNVTNSNPLVVQVEWAVNRTWSVFAVREENGLFGLDFLYKKRF